MADEPELPSLPRDWVLHNNAAATRKRVRDSPPPDSSDPPIFSSDDDPSVEKYTQGRQKRKQRFKGPWFDQQPASDSPFEEESHKGPVKSRRKFSRQVDSGVFMGSDGTDLGDHAAEGMMEVPQPRVSRFPLRIEPARDAHAQARIEKCLEKGDEIIDLSRCNLDYLSSSTIRPLASFIKPALPYSNLEPSLKIILASNLLTRLPAELFNLDRLVFLSLRNNLLHELPPGIAKLRNLEDLNISQNKLGYIPYEILELFLGGGTLYDFQLHPNPFYMPIARPETPPEEMKTIPVGLQRQGRLVYSSGLPRTQQSAWISTPTSSNEKCYLSYQCRTETRFLDGFGRLAKGPTFPSDPYWQNHRKNVKLPIADTNDIPKPPATTMSRAQSLLEVALKACSRNPELPHLESYLHNPPPYILSLLKQAENVNFSGPTLCTICKRSFIVPRTEWIEWWDISKVAKKDRVEDGATASAASPLRRVENERDAAERLVPLMRRGCSWLCVPPKEAPGNDEMAVDA